MHRIALSWRSHVVNYVATTSHAPITDTQANIVKSEKDIPATKRELVGHNRNKWLKAVMGDIKVTTMIPKSIDCGANRLRQFSAKMQNSQATWRRPAKKLGQTSRLPSISVQLEDGAPGMQIGSFVDWS